MKKTAALKKKLIFALMVVILLGLCAVGVYKLKQHYAIDWENGVLTVTEDPRSGYSYVVYKDHVELLKYTGNEQEIIIPDTLMRKPVTVIKRGCFRVNEKITTVCLGGNIQEVEEFAFYGCDQLEQVTGDAKLEIISKCMFCGCHLLKTVDVGNHIKRIEDSGFYACRALESIGEQPELEYIGEDAFGNAGPLTGFQVSANTEVDNQAFAGSEWFKNWLEENRTEEFVVLGAGALVEYRGNAETVEIPYGVTLVDSHIFPYSDRAGNIKEIYLPETVKEVESWAFDGCDEVRVYVPESVTTLDTIHLKAKDDGTGQLAGEGTVTIITTSGSYAEEYAKEYGVKCEIVEPWW